MRFASARIAARIDFTRNTPTGGSQCEMLVQCRRIAAPAEAWSKSRILKDVLYPQVLVRYPAIPKATITEPSVLTPAFNISGDNNVAMGHSAGSDVNGSSSVCIGHGVCGELVSTTAPRSAM
jgi:hypothetical protein